MRCLFLHRNLHSIKCISRRRIQSLNRSAVELSYALYNPQGASSGLPALLILHGLFGSKQNWNSLSKLMAKSYKGQIVAVDARNHGDSAHSPEMDYMAMAGDVAALMADRLGVQSAVLLGHSMGGKAAMTLALTQPQLVEALIVEDVSPTVSPGAKAMGSYAAAMRDMQIPAGVPLSQARRHVDKELASVVESTFVRQFLLMNLVEKEGRVQWRVNLDAINKSYKHIMDFPQFQSQYTGPTLFIGGAKSEYISESDRPEIMRLFPTADIIHIPEGSHYVHSEKPQAFAEAVLKFLGQVFKL